jgi:predicted kinase
MDRSRDGAAVVLMCGLPASGKTTAAMRLHAHLGGALIRSCDVYRDLGIALPEWVKRTAGFTLNVAAYDRLRDAAYVEMVRRVEASLVDGAGFVIVDAVHGERAKRQRLFELCAVFRALPILVVCTCLDFAEVQRRVRARRGREREPEHEASDLSVFYDIRRRWENPFDDTLPAGAGPPTVVYDSLNGKARTIPGADVPALAVIRAVLTG